MQTKMIENLVAILVHSTIVRNEAQRRIILETIENV